MYWLSLTAILSDITHWGPYSSTDSLDQRSGNFTENPNTETMLKTYIFIDTHILTLVSHAWIQSVWNIWWHGNCRASSEASKLQRQMGHTKSFSETQTKANELDYFTVSLHSPNGRHIACHLDCARDCQRPLETSGNSQRSLSPPCIATYPVFSVV